MEILKLLIQVITFLFGIFMLSSCSNGWYLSNLHLGSNDSSYVALVDQDSVTHHYDNNVSFAKDSWCYTHNQWEVIRKK